MVAGRILVPLVAVALLASCFAVRAEAASASERAALAELARDVDRVESVRAVKTLQRLYAQHAQFGRWREIGRLFVPDARFIFDGQIQVGQTFNGGAAIADFLRTRYGDGREGLADGDMRMMMIDAPLISLSTDGESANGRWSVLIFTGDGGKAHIEGGIFENDYVRRRGAWKIAAAHYYPQYFGPYESGWTNWGGGDLPVVPYHFTPDSAGVPIPAPQLPAPATRATLAELQGRIDALNAEDAVRNLQAAFGYYVDRKMWDDVVDLFAETSVVVAESIFSGRSGVRAWLETMGPAGLRHGQLNDRPQFDTIVRVAPGGTEAWARSIELGMLGDADREKGWWEGAVLLTRFVKEGGVWKIRELLRFPLFKSDYDLGWGKDGVAAPAPAPPLLDPAPRPLTRAIPAAESAPVSIEEARRRLARSRAWDGVENVSAAYTAYLDDLQSDKFGALIAEKGFKMSAFAGYYVGRDRVTEAGVRVWGKPPVTRPGVHFHWRVQPVILVAEDGRSANMRVRLFQPRTGKEVGGPGGWYGAYFYSGMYHDQFVLEDGVWRMWNLSLDEPYMSNVAWKIGWARAKDPQKPRTGAVSRLIQDGTFLPDVPVTALGKRQEHFWGGTGDPLQWPSILPMWFEYRNPVSGRVPEHFQKDCPPCTVQPRLRLDRNGYLEPSAGPEPVAPQG